MQLQCIDLFKDWFENSIFHSCCEWKSIAKKSYNMTTTCGVLYNPL